MKKLLSVLLCAVMVLSLAACGKKENAPTPGPDPNGETEGLTVALVVAGKTVKVAGGETAQITVRTIDGRTVRQAYADTLDLSDLGAGLYIVTATMADGRVVSTKVTM